MVPTVTQISMFYFPIRGGQETYIENLHNTLIKSNYSTKVLQVKRTSNNPDHVRTVPRLPHFFNKVLPDADWFGFNCALYTQKSFLQKSDLLICHYPFHYPAIAWHPRVIVLSHGVDWKETPISFADKYRFKALELCQIKKPIIVANDTYFLQKLGIHITGFQQEFQEVEDKIWYIPNCVNLEQFKPTNTIRKDIIFVPRHIRYERGIHLAIQAFHKFLKNSNYDHYEMWIAGTGQQGRYYRYCTRLIQELCLEKKVKFLGYIPWQSLSDYYCQVRLTLIPSIALEGTSLSALESMACMTPVVSTNIGGLNDLPTLKSSLSPKDIADKMVQVINNWNKYSQMQYDTVSTIFNLERWQSAWLTVINNCLK